MDSIYDFFDYLKNTVLSMSVIDFIDIAIVSVIIYYAIKFIKDKRAAKLFIGIFFLTMSYLISDALQMNALSFILNNVFQVGIIGLIIVFHPELRSMLEKVGGTPLNPINRIVEQRTVQKTIATIDTIVEVAADFSISKTGALIVIERTTKLGEFIKGSGSSELNAEISTFLLKNLFFDKAPLHDGAVIISNNLIKVAGCFLPLSTSTESLDGLGTRHRAGLGISENSDAVVVIVSEENGVISMAVDGKLSRNYNAHSLKSELSRLLLDNLVIRRTGSRRGRYSE